jgi:hypothetical protein
LTRKFSAPAFIAFTATLMSGWPVKTGSATSSQVLSSGFEAQGLSSRAFGHPEECSSWQFRLAAGPEIAEQMHKREPDTRQLLIVAGRLFGTTRRHPRHRRCRANLSPKTRSGCVCLLVVQRLLARRSRRSWMPTIIGDFRTANQIRDSNER